MPGIDGLRESAVTIEGVGLSDVGDFIFDAVRETTVEDVAECAIVMTVPDLFLGLVNTPILVRPLPSS